MPSTEMLKKLLEEFAEKEAHTREEINVINQRIHELEERIIVSKQRLQAVSEDRQKIMSMANRYGGGDWLGIIASATSGTKRPTISTEELDAIGARTNSNSSRVSATRMKTISEPAATAQPQPQSQPQAQPVAPAEEPSLAEFGYSHASQAETIAPTTPANPAAALSSKSFFSEDDEADDDDAANPFLKTIMGKAPSTPAELVQQQAPNDGYETDGSSNQPAAAPNEEQPAAPAAVADVDEDDGDDTVKSINDALRGLFR